MLSPVEGSGDSEGLRAPVDASSLLSSWGKDHGPLTGASGHSKGSRALELVALTRPS